MTKRGFCAALVAAISLLGVGAHAQQFEAVYSIEGVSSSTAREARGDLFSDPAMKGKVCLTCSFCVVGVQTIGLVTG